MAGPTTSLAWAELLVALLAIAGTAYAAIRTTLSSAESGYIYKYVIEPREKAKTAHKQVDAVEKKVDNIGEKVDNIDEKVGTQTDAVVAIGKSLSNGREFDVDAFEDLATERSVDRFMRDGED